MEVNQEAYKERSVFVIVLILIQIILVVVVAFIMSVFVHDDKISSVDYRRQPKIAIENITSVLPDATQDYLDVLGQKIARTIELNTQNYNISDSKAIIRDGTFKMTKLPKDNTSFYSMIIDIPNLEQSYQIYDHYASDNEPANRMYVLCLDQKSDIIYSNFRCKDDYPSDIRKNIVEGYLGYFDFYDFHTIIDHKNLNLVKIVPHSLDISESEKTYYINKTKEAIESLGVPATLFEYEIEDPRNLG